ncbi:MAG: toxin [Bacteroidales bacterium]|nr:toxin [Bacteroidales bacterium]
MENNKPKKIENQHTDPEQQEQQQNNSTGKTSGGTKNESTQQGSKSLINLPKGGGAIQSIGEKFETNPVTGTFSMSAPIAISPGRSGFSPQLGLSYNSGSGNSPFGIGWGVGIPNITRKTDKGLPQYDDDNDSDTFILSGAEDLVPFNEPDRIDGDFSIRRYIPRTEGLFARIEQWKNTTTGKIHWRTISKENITSIYGESIGSCVSHPTQQNKIFSWNLEKTFDAKGNLMLYSYLKENKDGIENSANEMHRLKSEKAFNKIYLDRVQYGNTTMYSPDAVNYTTNWLFTLVFDYGNYNGFSTANGVISPQASWEVRQDPFSVYKAGFELRTYRLCQRVLMFHQFSELGVDPVLVKSTNLQYTKNEHLTQLNKVTHTSHDGAETAEMPPLTFSYSEAQVGTKLHEVSPEMLENLPSGTSDSNWQWADLYGDGISSLLRTDNEAWYYKPNLGEKSWTQDTLVNEIREPELQLGSLKRISEKPNVANARGTSFYVGDVDSDSQPEVIVHGSGMHGYYSLEDGQWQNFKSFSQMPNIDLNDPNVKQIDLTGDGLADLLISHGDYFELYFSAGKEGYKDYRKISTGSDEDLGSVILFSDAKQSIHLADMSGDGLSDIVRINNNSVCYWPNMGYGRFGEKVFMKNTPLFDNPDIFNPSRIRLADVDGTGTTDLIYLATDAVIYYKNQAGNGWSNSESIAAFPSIDNLSQVTVTDLLGNGTSCLVWSSPLPSHIREMHFVELTSGIKPYILSSFENGMGRKVKLTFAPSTKFFIRDKLSGNPWITKLPFPVQVLEQVEDYEQVSDMRFVNKYAYHHGHYDIYEREFRGFGMVEQWDTEILNSETEGYQAPVYTKSWFHTGFWKNRETISQQFAQEYFNQDTEAWLLPDSVLPDNLSSQEEREACRALRGQLLRSEVYANDGSDKENIPYVVEEKNMLIKLIQAKGDNKHGVFMSIDNEAVSYNYERDISDPRISHALSLETDDYGNVVQAAQLAYPRRAVDALDEQKSLKVVCTKTDFINRSETEVNLIGIAYQNQSFEITGLIYMGDKFDVASLKSSIDEATEIDYSEKAHSGNQKRCFKHEKTLFYTDDLLASLPLGQIGELALPYQTYGADLTDALIDKIYPLGDPIIDDIFLNEGKYLYEEGKYWIPSEIVSYDNTQFYLPIKSVDAFGNESRITYDAHSLLVTKTADALLYETIALYDYRVLQPKSVTDPNDNIQLVSFDTLGMVKALALTGKNGEGDTIESPTIEYNYDLFCWQNEQKPIYAHVKTRETHATADTVWMEIYEYSGGHGNPVMTKVQAEDGDAKQFNEDGSVEIIATNNRWVGTGRTVLNNKGNVIKQYEPYFSTTHEYESEVLLTQNGVTPIFYYDPVGRNLKTDFPDGTLTRVEFTPWMQKNFDQNDTVTESAWYVQAGSPDPIGAEPTDENERAAWLSAQHANTPQVRYFDNLGREFIVEDDNNSDGKYRVTTAFDIAGRPVTVTDAKERVMTINSFGMQQPLAVSNIDSGTRQLFSDVTGNPIRIWDSRGHNVRMTYDELRRPLATYLTESDKDEIKVQFNEYGSSKADNSIGQVIKAYDQSGLSHINKYDFKGNPLESTKQFCEVYDTYIDWDNNPVLQSETFISQISYDALNRPVNKTLPNGTIETYTYNKASLLEKVHSGDKDYITNINYNEKGQRTDIYYGNNSKTKYEYDSKTFRLKRLLTTRNLGADVLQDLNYVYDAVGNIVQQNDNAQQTHYFSNSVIEPKGLYYYDALYRLIKAKGRELSSLTMPNNTDLANTIAVPNTAANAMQNYTQEYTYDELGNMMQLKSVGQWTRDYFYNFNNNNYLLGHTDGQTDYTYDAHGNALTMPHLQALNWDYQDVLTSVDLDVAGNKAHYVYDASGERVRKVVIKGNIKEERYYFGAYEIYRKFVNGTLDTERTTVNISDDKAKIATVDTQTVENSSLTINPTDLIRYQYSNHLGSASLELDDLAEIISYEEYHPFGTTSYRSGRTETETSQKRYKYVGKERDEETGLYYYGARYYAAWICRFVSVDPLQFEYAYYTPYQYAGNKPITFIDLDGLEEAPAPLVENLQTKRDNTNLATPFVIPVEFSEQKETGFTPSMQIPEKEPATIGPYNPEGFNENFIKKMNIKWQNKHDFDERLLKAQQISPVVFGNPGQPHGAGMYSSLEAGLEVYSVIEGGYGLYKGGMNLYAKGAKLLKKPPKVVKGSIKLNEVTTFDDFTKRSVVGDNLEGHEVLQHANLNERGLTITRLSTEASKSNPVIALEKATHQEVNAAQKVLKPRIQSGIENIKSNTEILRRNPNIPNSAVKKIKKAAIKHNKKLRD